MIATPQRERVSQAHIRQQRSNVQFLVGDLRKVGKRGSVWIGTPVELCVQLINRD